MVKARPTIFYIIFFLFILAFSTTANAYDYDFWARLIAGMSVVQTGHVLKHDFLSYTPTHTWFDHEWGSGVIFYLTQHFFSSAGILILQALLVFAIYFVIVKIVDLRGVKTTSAYNFLFYFFSFSAMSQLINNPVRCQLFTFLFFTIFLYILELARKGNNKSLFVIPLLMIIWNNLHGGCVSGIGLILLYIVGEFLNRKPVKQYVLAFIASCLILPINPWGFEYLKFLFMANTMQRGDVAEWWGPFSKHLVFQYIKFKIYMSVLVLSELAIVIKQFISKTLEIDKTKFLVLAVTLFLAIEHVKMIPFFVIASTCFLYDDFYTVFNSITRNVFNKIANVKDIIIYVLILIFALANINKNAFSPLVNLDKYPVRAIEFMKINKIKGNLLLPFGQGSYASYKLYPDNKIFMDGRYEEVYNDYMVPLMKNFSLLNPGWDEILKRFPPDIIMVEKFYPVFEHLKKDKKWKLVFEDKTFGLFVKSNMVKEYKEPSGDLNYYRKTLFDTNINFMLQSKHELQR